MGDQAYHIPVLLMPTVDGLDIVPDGIYVDVTFGGGGHSLEILKRMTTGRLIALDQDPRAHENAPHDDRFTLIHGNFRFLENFLAASGAPQVDGILADLGVSSHQFDDADRGFSIRFEGALDMMMNPTTGMSARDLLNTASQEDLASMFRRYGELKSAWRIAETVVKHRSNKPLTTTTDLRNAVEHLANAGQLNKFLAQVFQAIRIAVNGELEALEAFLEQLPRIVKPGGRVSIISYHSLEDRLVKHFFRSGNFDDKQHKDLFGNIERPFNPINRKAILPNQEEIENNNRARSARLRIAERNHGKQTKD